MKRIAVVGSGTMGYGLAFLFAKEKWNVTLVGRREESLRQAMQRVEEAAQTFHEEGVLRAEEKRDITASITATTDLARGVREADWVIEAIPEERGAKQELLVKVEDAVRPDTVITSTTSSLPVAVIAENAKHPERMMITHFLNPPHLIPLVEVVKHPATRQHVVDQVFAALRSVRAVPVLLRNDVPGFVANRLQAALFREVLHLLQQDVADPEVIDTVVKEGLGFRWNVMGPIETADFGGLDTWARAGAYLAPHLATSVPLDFISRKFQAGELGVKTGKGFYSYAGADIHALVAQRDRQLIRLLQWKDKNR
jgi:3-hydroxybutyryl-CoA dehydrogenase